MSNLTEGEGEEVLTDVDCRLIDLLELSIIWLSLFDLDPTAFSFVQSRVSLFFSLKKEGVASNAVFGCLLLSVPSESGLCVFHVKALRPHPFFFCVHSVGKQKFFW